MFALILQVWDYDVFRCDMWMHAEFRLGNFFKSMQLEGKGREEGY